VSWDELFHLERGGEIEGKAIDEKSAEKVYHNPIFE
jgi:hypothetical protein